MTETYYPPRCENGFIKGLRLIEGTKFRINNRTFIVTKHEQYWNALNFHKNKFFVREFILSKEKEVVYLDDNIYEYSEANLYAKQHTGKLENLGLI